MRKPSNVTDPVELEFLREMHLHEQWFNNLSEVQQEAVAPFLQAFYAEMNRGLSPDLAAAPRGAGAAGGARTPGGVAAP